MDSHLCVHFSKRLLGDKTKYAKWLFWPSNFKSFNNLDSFRSNFRREYRIYNISLRHRANVAEVNKDLQLNFSNGDTTTGGLSIYLSSVTNWGDNGIKSILTNTVADAGLIPEGGAPTPKSAIIFANFLPISCMKMHYRQGGVSHLGQAKLH